MAEVGGNEVTNPFEVTAKLGIQNVKGFTLALKLPKNLKEAGVDENKLEYLAEKATEWGEIGPLCKIGKAEALKIYKKLLYNIFNELIINF